MLGNLNTKQIEELLSSSFIGRIGCTSDGKTYIVPITYFYENNFPICHTRNGLKVEMMRKNPNVCFEIDKMENMSNWQSVIVQGVYDELELMGSIDDGLRVLGTLHPLGYVGEPDDIGYGVVYHASDESKFITGSELVIDGAYRAR